MDIGFLGLGRMGRAMAGNLVKAGHNVRVWNRSPEAAKAVEGAKPVATPAEAFRGDAAVTMFADDAALRSVLLDGTLLQGKTLPAVHVNMATIAVAFGKELAALHQQAGVAYVAAPVFGRPDAAEKAALQIVAAGEDGAIASVQPLLDAMGAKTWRFGEAPERANAVKLAGNFLIISAIEAMSEASAFVEGHDIGRAEFIDLLTSTLFASPVYKNYGGMIAERRYEPPGFNLRLAAKDVRLALAAAEAAGVPMPFASVLRDNFLDAISHGDAEKDMVAIAAVAERRSGRA